MNREEITSDTLVALAAGMLDRATADSVRAHISVDDGLAHAYATAGDLVAELGPAGAMDHIDALHAKAESRIQEVIAEPVFKQRTPGWLGGMGWLALPLAACLLLVLIPMIVSLSGNGDDDLALAVLNEPPQITFSRGTEAPDWAPTLEQRDYPRLFASLRAEPQPLAPRERFLLGYCFLRSSPPQPDSARFHIEQVAATEGLFQDEALLYSGVLALQAGDTAVAEVRLKASGDQRAGDILRRLEKK